MPAEVCVLVDGTPHAEFVPFEQLVELLDQGSERCSSGRRLEGSDNPMRLLRTYRNGTFANAERIEWLAQMVERAAEQHPGKRAVLAGYSAGGYLIYAAVTDDRVWERLDPLLARVITLASPYVLIGPVNFQNRDGTMRIREKPIQAELPRISIETVAARLKDRLTVVYGTEDPVVLPANASFRRGGVPGRYDEIAISHGNHGTIGSHPEWRAFVRRL